jgi:hypothetical protein
MSSMSSSRRRSSTPRGTHSNGNSHSCSPLMRSCSVPALRDIQQALAQLPTTAAASSDAATSQHTPQRKHLLARSHSMRQPGGMTSVGTNNTPASNGTDDVHIMREFFQRKLHDMKENSQQRQIQLVQKLSGVMQHVDQLQKKCLEQERTIRTLSSSQQTQSSGELPAHTDEHPIPSKSAPEYDPYRSLYPVYSDKVDAAAVAKLLPGQDERVQSLIHDVFETADDTNDHTPISPRSPVNPYNADLFYIASERSPVYSSPRHKTKHRSSSRRASSAAKTASSSNTPQPKPRLHKHQHATRQYQSARKAQQPPRKSQHRNSRRKRRSASKPHSQSVLDSLSPNEMDDLIDILLERTPDLNATTASFAQRLASQQTESGARALSFQQNEYRRKSKQLLYRMHQNLTSGSMSWTSFASPSATSGPGSNYIAHNSYISAMPHAVPSTNYWECL